MSYKYFNYILNNFNNDPSIQLSFIIQILEFHPINLTKSFLSNIPSPKRYQMMHAQSLPEIKVLRAWKSNNN